MVFIESNKTQKDLTKMQVNEMVPKIKVRNKSNTRLSANMKQ